MNTSTKLRLAARALIALGHILSGVAVLVAIRSDATLTVYAGPLAEVVLGQGRV